MPAIITRPIPVSKDASSSVIDSGSSTLTHSNVLLGISVGCASLVAVIASIVAWRYLKRHRKDREEMSAPDLVLDGNAIERNEVQCILNLVPEKDAFTVIPPITSAPILPQLLFTPALEGMSLSDSDSESSISDPTEDVLELDDWDFKCRGQRLEDVAGDCDDPYSSQEIVSTEAIQDALTLISSPPITPFEEDETVRPAKHSADGNLWATSEGDEGNEGSKGKADESMSMCRFESAGIARKVGTQESTQEVNDKSSRHGFEQDLRSKDDTNAMHNGDAKHASVAVDEDLWTMKDFIACESSETEMIGIDIENDAPQLIENDAEAEAATEVAVKEIMLSTPASEVESIVGPDSSLEKGFVEEEDNYHFSEVAPIQGFMNNAVEKDEDLHAKADDSTVALSLVELDIPMALQMTELHEPGTLPIHSRPSASSELVTGEVGMPIVVSGEGKDDSTRFSDFLFNEKCLGKSQGKDVMKTDVRNTEGEKEKLEIDQVRDVCARDVEERHETGALAANSGRFVAHNEPNKLSIAPTTSSLASPAISDTIKLGSKISVDESSHNGQCSPPWWEVLEKIKQDPLGCNGVEMFREWAIKNGIASEHVKQRPKSKPLAKLIKPAPLPMKAGVRKASIPVKDREVIKRDLEKMFREWWAAGNEAILGPLEDGPCVRSDQVVDTSSKLSHPTSSKQDQHSSICDTQDKCIGAIAGEEMDYDKSLGSLIDFPPSSETSCNELDAKKSSVEDKCGGKLDDHHERENFNSSRVLDHILSPSPNSPTKKTHEAPITPRNLAGVKSGLSTVARTPVKIAQQKTASSPGPLRRARLHSEAASTPTAKGTKATGSGLRGYITSSNQSRIAATTSPSKLSVSGAKPRLTTINHGKFARSPPSSTTCRPSSGSVAKVEPSSSRHRSLASPVKPAWNSPTSQDLGSSSREEITHRKVDSKRAIALVNRAQTMRIRRDTLSPLKPAVNDETSMDKENTAPVNGTHAPRRGSSSELSAARRNGSPGCVAPKNI